MILMYLFHVSLISKNSINPDRLQKSAGAYYLFSAVQFLLSVGVLGDFSD